MPSSCHRRCCRSCSKCKEPKKHSCACKPPRPKKEPACSCESCKPKQPEKSYTDNMYERVHHLKCKDRVYFRRLPSPEPKKPESEAPPAPKEGKKKKCHKKKCCKGKCKKHKCKKHQPPKTCDEANPCKKHEKDKVCRTASAPSITSKVSMPAYASHDFGARWQVCIGCCMMPGKCVAGPPGCPCNRGCTCSTSSSSSSAATEPTHPASFNSDSMSSGWSSDSDSSCSLGSECSLIDLGCDSKKTTSCKPPAPAAKPPPVEKHPAFFCRIHVSYNCPCHYRQYYHAPHIWANYHAW